MVATAFLSTISYCYLLNILYVKVQTGFGRLGSSFWAFEDAGVVPDIGKVTVHISVIRASSSSLRPPRTGAICCRWQSVIDTFYLSTTNFVR